MFQCLVATASSALRLFIYIYIHLHIYPGSHVHVPDFVETLTFAVVLPRMIQGDGVSQ